MAKDTRVFAAKDESGQMVTVGNTGDNGRPTVLGETVIQTNDELQLLKKHVRADDFTEDDVYLQYLLDVAEDALLRKCNRTREELILIGKGGMPRAFLHAKVMVAAHWYNQREPVSQGEMKEVPYTLSALIKPLTKLV